MQMLGTRDDQILRSKGAETKGLVFWVVELLGERFANYSAKGDLILAAGRNLKEHIELLDSDVRCVPPAVTQRLLDTYKRYVACLQAYDETLLTPK
eukprot:6297322-Alexandrium_andersonii.AAC.1